MGQRQRKQQKNYSRGNAEQGGKIACYELDSGLCVDCRDYEIIFRMPDDGYAPELALEDGWCAEHDCLVKGVHFPCEKWVGR